MLWSFLDVDNTTQCVDSRVIMMLDSTLIVVQAGTRRARRRCSGTRVKM